MRALPEGPSLRRRFISTISASTVLPLLVQSQIRAFEASQDIDYRESIAKDQATVSIAANENFSSCTCDLTPKGCDHACCCDSYCAPEAVAKWRLKPGYCLDEMQDNAVIAVGDCVKREQQAVLEDLQGGLHIYEKQARSLMCMQTKQEQSYTSFFIDQTFQAKTQEEFDRVRAAEIQDTSSYTFLQPPVDDGILINTAAGYQPHEYLRGSSYKQDAAGQLVALFRDDDKISFSRPGIFGHCEAKTPALFMKNLKEDTCVVSHAPVSAETCSSVNFSSIMKMLKGDGVTTELLLTPSVNVKKFDLNTFLEVTTLTAAEQEKINNQQFIEAQFASNAGLCQCDNFVLEAHYKVYFDQSDTNAYRISDFEVDLVYGKLTQECTAPHTFNLQTSLTFLEKKTSRKLSGSPGYLRGSPVNIGQTETVTVPGSGQGTATPIESIVLNNHGFPLRGASNDGKCYFVDQAVSGDKKKLSASLTQPLSYPMIENADVKTYYEDPVLTFEDSLIYGCSIELNLEEFKDFCTNNLYQHLMLFQNLFQMNKVGVSGNSDPHYTKDWLDVEVPANEDTFVEPSTLGVKSDTCILPSTRVVEIFYKRVNTEKEPQYIVMKMQHYSPARTESQWRFSQPNPTKKQTFMASVVVNSYIVDQDITLFVPTFKDLIQPLDRNILYPFFVYSGQENQN